jgi:hypothetical protein
MDDVRRTSQLTEADRRLLDRLIEVEFSIEALGRLSDDERERARAILQLLNLLEDYPVEDADDTLIHATMARIDQYEDRRHQRLRMPAVPADQSRQRRLMMSVRLPDLVSVAAMFLIGASILIPILNNLHKKSVDLRARSNLDYVNLAVNSYANDYDGRVPMAQAGMDSMWNTFTQTLNLTPLVEGDYCQISSPERPAPTTADGRREFGRNNLVLLLSDRNPLIESIRRNRLPGPLNVNQVYEPPSDTLLSPNGAILWLTDPQAVPERNATRWRPYGVLWLRDEIRPDDQPF